MRFLIPIVAMLSISIHASAVSATTQLSAAFGASVPIDTTGQTLTEKGGPSRINGGETFIVKMSSAKMITDIKITSYSTAHKGKSLIHSAKGLNGSHVVVLDGLSTFAKVTAGNPVNYKNLVMLPDTAFVEVTPNQAFTQLEIMVEGFADDDTSLLLHITTSDALPIEQFLITRTGPNSAETLGSLVNEANYAKFQPADLKELLTQATQPTAAELSGKTFTCSVYSRLNPTQVNYKTRTYSIAATGALQSISDLEGGSDLIWAVTPDGLTLALNNSSGCGNYVTGNIVRKTAGGNLVSEVDLDLGLFIAECQRAGYDPAGTQAVEMNSTFPSVINPKYVVNSYEFCRAVN